jgi:hypothetical protein
MPKVSRFCDPQAIAAKVRQLVSSAGLRLIEFSAEEEERAAVTSKFLAVLCPRIYEGPWVSERAEAKENRKIPWNALLSRRMLAYGLTGGNEAREEKGKSCRGAMKLSRSQNCGSLAARGENCKD